MSFDLPDLPEGWQYVPLEACAVPGSISYGVVQPGASVSVGVPIVRVNNFSDSRLDLADVMRVAPEVEAKYSRTRLNGGEVLLTLVGSVGQVAEVPPDCTGFNVARAVGVVRPASGYEAKWLAICLRSPLSQFLLGSRANTTVQTTINLKDVRALPVPMPPPHERAQIIEMVGALDDRIALLRETNATLEAIAQALFKSWFVDFDPVHAKSQGLAPAGLDEATAALFPDQFAGGTLGALPAGWSIEPLGNWLDVLETGRRPKGGVSGIEEGVPSIGAESVIRVGQFDYSKTKFVSREFFASMKSGALQSHDVLLYKDGGKPGVFLPRVSMFGDGFPFEVCGINEHVFRMRAKAPMGQIYLYFLIWSNAVMHELKHRGGKAAIPGINQTDVKEIRILVPDGPVLRRFEDLTGPLIASILNNAKRSQSLASLRDSLFPRLIAGQLRLHDIAGADVAGI